MDKKQFAKDLMLEEIEKEHGQFVTQRMIDRLRIFYAPMFESAFLSGLAEEVNLELERKAS